MRRPDAPATFSAPLLAAASAVLVPLLAGCASDSLVTGPVGAMPLPRPAAIERVATGGIYQAATFNSAFTGRRKPLAVGDALKVEISESMSATNKAKTDASRKNTMVAKGPGGSSDVSFLHKLLNLDASASGSDSFNGDGSSSNSSSFTGTMAASVINVLANGNLVVAGERSISMNGDVKLLRFSGVVDPQDLKLNNTVASADVVNARFEIAGRGDVSEAGRRTWLQRVLTSSMAIW
ncbi:flagellar basal body L-ring protein FlgH [Xylophilus sp.]|uniref:flagellar basal body L-ring protein FlgH n=1 Tax=Xylophilus sp. TaxID=2653893 RepID=UPI0013B8D394|nr:flagellar basal body L-ring protein FlgH [Xylophilus sp.]KAF1045005.1 MAG: Flagellar L-ring protein [Xylophilus sp.]